MRHHRLPGAVLLGLSLAWAGIASAQTAPAPAPKTTPSPRAQAPAKSGAAKAKPKSDAAPPATAAAPAPKKVSKGEAQALQWFQMLDADGDGRVSRKEAEVGFRLRPSLKKDFEDADLNKDGHLTQDEIRAVADRRRAERQARRERERAAAARQSDTSSIK